MLRTLFKATSNWLREQVGIYRARTALFVLVIFLTSAPQLVGLIMTPDGGRYLGRTLLAPGDTMVYYGAIQEAAQGKFFISNPFTQEPQRARLIQPVWFVHGWVMKITRLPVEVVYYLGLLVTIAVFFGFLWRLTGLLTANYHLRLKIQFLLLFSSGFGWIDYIALRQGASYDLWVSEFNTFLTMMHSSLFMISQVLLAWLLMRWWKMMRTGQITWWWGGAVALLGVLHPYDLVTLGLTCFFLLVAPIIAGTLSGKHLINIFLAILWLMPVAFYYHWILQEPVLAEWAKQNIDRVGPMWRVLLGLGCWAPLAIYGAIVAWKKKLFWTMPFVLWIFSVAILILLPGLTFQRRLVNGIHIPFILLSMVGVAQYIRTWSPNWKRFGWLIGATVVTATTIIVIVHHSMGFIDSKRSFYPSYLTADDQEAIMVVTERVPKSMAVWANPWTANAIAGLLVRPVVVGHGHQTSHAVQKFQWWEDLRSAETTDAEWSGIIAQTSPWLLWNVRDQSGDYAPEEDPHWELIWRGQESALYYYHVSPTQ